MTSRYLVTLSDTHARRLEGMLGGRIEIIPSTGLLRDIEGAGDPQRAVIAGLDAITDEEYEMIARRLRSGGPLARD